MENNLAPVSTAQKEEMFTPKGYKVRSGTSDSGKNYEKKVTALLALKCCSENLQNFWLAANVDGFGALDDIIMFKKSEENDEGITYCMQLKHQEKPKNIIKDMFLSSKGDFSLELYSGCHNNLKSAINDETQNADIIKHLRQVKNMVFIIFTNKGVSTNLEFLKKPKERLLLDSFQIQGNIYGLNCKALPTLKHNEEFLEKLFLYTNQPHNRKMDNLIECAIKDLLHPLQLSDGGLRDIAQKFAIFVGEWSEGYLNGHYPLTKTDILKKLTELLLLPYIINLQEPNNKKNDGEENNEAATEEKGKEDSAEYNIWYELTKNENVTIVDELDDEVQRYINDVTYNIVSNGNIFNSPTAVNRELLRVVNTPNDMCKSDKHELLWKTRKIHLLLQVSDSEGVSYTQEILKLFPDVFRVTILNKTKYQLENFKVLNKEHQEIILKYPVKLRNKVLSIKELNIDKSEFFRSLKVNDIVRILCGKFNIDSEFEQLPEFFVEMSLSRNTIDITALEKYSGDIFVVKFECTSNCKSFLVDQLGLTENEVIQWKQLNERNFTGRIIIFDLIENLHKIEEFCLTLNKRVHVVVWHGGGKLELVKTNNTYKNENLSEHYKLLEESNSKSVSAKESLEHFCQSKKPLLVSADPGMGKSVLINYFSQNLPINLWGLRINLAKHKDHFVNWHSENSNLQELNKCFKLFLEDVLREQKICNSNIFEQYLNSKRVVLLLDGFDEVPVNCQNGAKQLIRFINESRYYMCVTTRPVMKRDLESVLNTFAVTLNPFTLDEQKYFLRSYFADSGNITPSDNKVILFVNELLEAARKNLNDIDNEFTGIPLQTKLLAEVFKNDFLKYVEDGIFKNQHFDLIYLYQHFIDKKIKIACSKVANGSEDLMEVFSECRSMYALRHLFSAKDLEKLKIDETIKTITRSLPYALQIIQKDGIIVIDSESNVSFVHQTYAEFLAAKWLSENLHLSDKSVVQKLIEKTFDFSFLVVRNMFDRLLAKNCPLHIAIINRQINTVKKIIASDENVFTATDKGRRNILHLIAAYGLHHPNGFRHITQNMINNDDMMIILKLIFNNKLTQAEDLLKYTPLDYAVLSRSLSIANRICKKLKTPNLCISITKAETDNILNYVVAYYSVPLFAVILRCHIKTEFELPFENEDETNDLYKTISEGNVENVRALISTNNINMTDHNGSTPLHIATKNAEITRFLLSKGASVNKRDNNGRSPLHWASYQGHLDIVSLMISNGAEVTARDRYDRTALHYLLLSSSNQCDAAPTLIKSQSGIFTRAFNTVLTKLGYAFNSSNKTANFLEIKDNYNMNALHWATQMGKTGVINLILSQKVDVDARGFRNMTALLFAVQNNDIDTVKLLLTNGANVEANDVDNETPLHFAARGEHIDIVSFLLSNGAHIEAKNKYNRTPLHFAVFFGHKDIIDLLLTNDADIEAKDKNGDTPLHIAVTKGHKNLVSFLLRKGANIKAKNKINSTPLHLAVIFGYEDVTNLLLANGADIEEKDNDGETLLHFAARTGRKDLVSFLLNNGAHIEAKNNDNDTPLHFAVFFGHKDTVNLLLTNNADVEAKDKNGDTPLHFAARIGHKDIVSFLLSNGAQIEARNNFNRTPLHFAVFYGLKDIANLLLTADADVEAKDKIGDTPLHFAARTGRKALVSFLLSNGANIEAKNKINNTPLHYAAGKGHKDIVRFLLTEGAHIEAKNMYNRTPLHFAVFFRHRDVTACLLTEFADIEAKDKNDDTPLHMAAYEGHMEIVSALLSNGAYIEPKNKNNDTPLHLALLNNHKHIESYLLMKGAHI